LPGKKCSSVFGFFNSDKEKLFQNIVTCYQADTGSPARWIGTGGKHGPMIHSKGLGTQNNKLKEIYYESMSNLNI
jgi:hypothetical protein